MANEATEHRHFRSFPLLLWRMRDQGRGDSMFRVLLLLFCFGLFSAKGAESLSILPTKISLSGPAARQEILVERFDGAHFVGQLTNGVELTSSDPKVLRIDGNSVLPLTNGTAKILVKADGMSATTDVTVSGMEKPFEWSFRNHVQPVLARMGCSAGACHGAAAGQNGFKLSLRGYDDEGDFLA